MADPISKFDAHASADTGQQAKPAPAIPVSGSRPGHAFPGKFDQPIVQHYSKADAHDGHDVLPNWLNRLMELNLFFLILLVGVPVLVYCILASGT